MRGNEFLNKMELIDPAYIEAAEAAPRRRGQGWVKRIGAIAACLALLLSLGLGTYAYAAEVKEYNDAVRFFGDNGLSTSGLTREDIKAVYRDITTKSFTYSKTAEVIMNSLTTDQIGGFEIPQDAPTPEDVENLWNYKVYTGKYWVDDEDATRGIHYKTRSVDKKDPQLGFNVHDRSFVEKYDGDTLIWSISFSEFWIYDVYPVSDGVIACGQTPTISSSQTPDSWIAKVDENGTVMWKHMFENRLDRMGVARLFENSDGSYSIIGSRNLDYLCLVKLSADGNETYFKETYMGDYGIGKVSRFSDGYIVKLQHYADKDQAHIIKVDNEGNITDRFIYSSENSYCFVTDMIEFNGKIYLSAHAVPKVEEKIPSVGRTEIAAILDYIDHRFNISSEELTPVVRNNFTAMLIVCDPDVGTPQEFYSVKGSLGGELSVGESGELLWDVESITTVSFSPYTSAYTFRGSSYVYRYTFDASGALISQEKTGEVASFIK